MDSPSSASSATSVHDQPDDAKGSGCDAPDIPERMPGHSRQDQDRGRDQPDSKGLEPGEKYPSGPPGAGISTQTEKGDWSYNLSSGDRLAIVFNHKEFPMQDLKTRKGSEKDTEKIHGTFKGLGFKVEIYNDLPREDIFRLLDDLAEKRGRLACLALFFLTHGYDNGKLTSRDGEYRLFEDVVPKLLPDACPSLAGQPKMIFVQACQGEKADKGQEVKVSSRPQSSDAPDSNTHSAKPSTTYTIPMYSDFLYYLAAYKDHTAFRNEDYGSWFIKALCEKLKECQPDEWLLQVLTKANRQVALDHVSNCEKEPRLHRTRQTPMVQHTLLRAILLGSDAATKKRKSSQTPDSEHRSPDSADEPEGAPPRKKKA